MKKKTIILNLMFMCLLITLFTGCAKNNSAKQNANNQINGDAIWDYSTGNQPYLQDWHHRIYMQKNGFYFVDPGKRMLYFYDYTIKKSLPVCSKPDCEHLSGVTADGNRFNMIVDGQEVEQYNSPVTTCDAYLGYGYGNMTCVNDRLYYDSMDDDNLMTVGHSICSVSMDGSDHRVEIENFLNQKSNAAPISIHFTDGKVFFETNQDAKKTELKVIDLTTKKVKTILSVDTTIYALDPPTMYHKKAYYILWEHNPSSPSASYYGTLYEYSFHTHKRKAIYKGDITGYTFVNNQILFSDKKSICSISLDDGKVKPLFDAPSSYSISFDGQYLYLDNNFFTAKTFKYTDLTPIQVTKLDGTKVDSIDSFAFTETIYGNQKVYLVEYMKNENFSSLALLNKTELGKAHHFYDLITGKELLKTYIYGIKKSIPINVLNKK